VLGVVLKQQSFGSSYVERKSREIGYRKNPKGLGVNREGGQRLGPTVIKTQAVQEERKEPGKLPASPKRWLKWVGWEKMATGHLQCGQI